MQPCKHSSGKAYVWYEIGRIKITVFGVLGFFFFFFAFFLPPTCWLFCLCICFKCASHCYDLGSTKLKCTPFVLSDTRDTWWVLLRDHVSEISGFCGDSRKDCGNQRVGSGGFISSFKDSVTRFYSRRKWTYLGKKPGSEFYESDAQSSRLPACTGCSQHETARDERCWCPGPSEACRMKGAVSIWPETVVIPGSAAVTRPLSLAHAFMILRLRGPGLQGWWGNYGLDGEVRSQW